MARHTIRGSTILSQRPDIVPYFDASTGRTAARMTIGRGSGKRTRIYEFTQIGRHQIEVPTLRCPHQACRNARTQIGSREASTRFRYLVNQAERLATLVCLSCDQPIGRFPFSSFREKVAKPVSTRAPQRLVLKIPKALIKSVRSAKGRGKTRPGVTLSVPDWWRDQGDPP